MQKMQKIMNKLKKFQAAKDIVTVRDMGLLVSIAAKMGRMGKLCGNFVETHRFCREKYGVPQNFHTIKLGKTLVFSAVACVIIVLET